MNAREQAEAIWKYLRREGTLELRVGPVIIGYVERPKGIRFGRYVVLVEKAGVTFLGPDERRLPALTRRLVA
jgi:hypothetical protein